MVMRAGLILVVDVGQHWPVASRMQKLSVASSTDHGGGKRRDGGMAKVLPGAGIFLFAGL
jgi:hypothetical protein